MKLLITGVTGFLGGRLAHAFTDAGHDVVGFVRDPARWDGRPEGAATAVGDVTDKGSLERAIAGCDAVVHAAALVKMWVRDPRQFDRVNVEGLGNVLEVARGAGARVLYASSFIALGPTDGATFDVDTPRAGDAFMTHYERTKWIADRMAREVDPAANDLVRLYPGVVYGPGTLTQGNLLVQLFLQHARGKLPGLIGSGGLRQCFAYVEDVCAGFVAALDRARAGSGYVLGGENKTVRELFASFERASGIAPPKRTIPYGVARVVGKLQRFRAWAFNVEPELTDDVVEVYKHEWAYTSERSERDLGYRVTSLDDGVSRTVAWLREIGELS